MTSLCDLGRFQVRERFVHWKSEDNGVRWMPEYQVVGELYSLALGTLPPWNGSSQKIPQDKAYRPSRSGRLHDGNVTFPRSKPLLRPPRLTPDFKDEASLG